jgi:hypothetical protein
MVHHSIKTYQLTNFTDRSIAVVNNSYSNLNNNSSINNSTIITNSNNNTNRKKRRIAPPSQNRYTKEDEVTGTYSRGSKKAYVDLSGDGGDNPESKLMESTS